MDDLIRKRSATERLIIAKTLLETVLQDMPTAEPELANNSPKVENGNGDLISRQAAIDAITKYCLKYDLRELLADIECLPTADLSEYSDKLWKTAYERGKAEADPRKGKWIDYCGGVKCDQCGFECDDTYYLGEANFCPNCGARMEELA